LVFACFDQLLSIAHCKNINIHVYTCSGYCPYLSLPPSFDGTLQSALVKCDWEERQVAPDIAAAGMYCQVPDDDCPDYNAFDKDVRRLFQFVFRLLCLLWWQS